MSIAGKLKTLGVSLLAVPLLLSCATGGSSGKSIFSSGGQSGYALPTFTEKTLPNGLRVLFVPDEKLPYISYSLLIRSGSTQDPNGQEGLSAIVAELLDKGTAKRSAPQIAQDLGNLGADFDASASYDYSVVSLSGLSTQAEPLLANLVEIVTQPAFSQDEVERVRKQFFALINRRVDDPDAFADLAFAEFVYGEHPYGDPTTGTKESVSAIRRKNIIQHYLRHYRPNNAILAVVGKSTPELNAKIEQVFGTWQNREVPPVQFPKIAPIEGQQIRLVDKPGMVQAQIRIGHPGIKRQSEDFLALRVANTILGGAFASRLNDRIRKELGLTYGITSAFDARQDVGPFEIGTFTKNESVGQAVQETLKVLADFKEKGATADEVERVKGYLKGVFPTTIETREKLALSLMLLRFYGIPDTYLTNYLRDIDRLSVGDINRVIRTHIDPKNVKVLVFGSAPTILPQLQPLAAPKAVEVKKPVQ